MIGHLGIAVPDLDGARDFFAALMPMVDFEPFLDDGRTEFAYRPGRGRPGTYLFFYPAASTEPFDPARAGLQHLAFMVATRSRVHEVHDWATGRFDAAAEGPPREYPEYGSPYYACFLTGPGGLRLEVVCHHDRD